MLKFVSPPSFCFPRFHVDFSDGIGEMAPVDGFYPAHHVAVFVGPPDEPGVNFGVLTPNYTFSTHHTGFKLQDDVFTALPILTTLFEGALR